MIAFSSAHHLALKRASGEGRSAAELGQDSAEIFRAADLTDHLCKQGYLQRLPVRTPRSGPYLYVITRKGEETLDKLFRP